MHLSSRLPKKNYDSSLNGFDSEERHNQGGVNFKNQGFHHNTMGKKHSKHEENKSDGGSKNYQLNVNKEGSNSVGSNKADKNNILKLP